MKNKTYVFLLIIVLLACMSNSLAENKTVQIGETGISFKVDSSFDIITESNKKEYSQGIQNSITNDKQMLVYSSEKGAFSVSYDQGKNLEKYDLSNKKVEDIMKNYKDYIGDEVFDNAIGEYDFSVYDSGSYKWIKVDMKSVNLVSYATVQGNSSVTTVFSKLGYNQNEIESVIDTFTFGTPSFWSQIKSIASSITAFGNGILGGYGVYIVWSLIGGLGLYLVALIATIVGSVFKKK